MTLIQLTDQPVALDNGLQGTPLEITTANPSNYYQAISDPQQMEQAQIYGQLYLPKQSQNKAEPPWPVVIIVPGSLGVAPSHMAKAKKLTAQGIAACVIDPFSARGVASTVANQAQYSFAASAWDVLAAADKLSKRSEIDTRRIGAQGHSRGGSAIIAAACMTPLVPNAIPLRGLYAAYPWCGMQFLTPNVGATRVRSIIGDKDEWCLPQQVQRQMHAMRLCGADATCKIIAGAHHSFDRDTSVELVKEASVAPGAPTIYIQNDGTCVHPLTNEAKPDFSERELMLYGIKAGYGVRGAHIGSADNHAAQFDADMMAFWNETLC